MTEEPATKASGRELMRRRVERRLEDFLMFLGIALRQDRRPRQDTLSFFEELVAAFSAVGLLSEDEAAAWRERFARAVEAVGAPDDAVVTPEVRARAGDLVEAHLARLESGEAEDPGGEEAVRFYAMLTALAHVGAITIAERQGWQERRELALRRREPPPAPPPSAPAELRRVVAGPARRTGGVRLICAELWDERVVLRWHRVMSAEEVAAAERHRLRDESSEPMENWRRAAETFELRDDLGTRYEAQLLGSGEDGPAVGVTVALAMASEPQPVWGQAFFGPAVPSEATRLEAVRGAERLVLELA